MMGRRMPWHRRSPSPPSSGNGKTPYTFYNSSHEKNGPSASSSSSSSSSLARKAAVALTVLCLAWGVTTTLFSDKRSRSSRIRAASATTSTHHSSTLPALPHEAQAGGTAASSSSSSSFPMLSGFNERCYMVEVLDETIKPESYYGSGDSSDSSEEEDDSDDEEDDDSSDSSDDDEDDDDEEEDDDGYYADEHYPDYSIGRNDRLHLGRCRHDYPETFPPPEGYINGIDFFFLRHDYSERDKCFLYCLTQLPRREVNLDLLADAVRMGLVRVVHQLVTVHGLDPLGKPSKGTQQYPRTGLTPIHEAILGGHTQVLATLLKAGHYHLDTVIDEYGRSVRDYITLRGSPIRPAEAKQYLGIDTYVAQATQFQTLPHIYRGWNGTMSRPADERCDIEVVDDMPRDTFYRDYWMTGRPFIWRNVVPEGEMELFGKERLSTTKYYNPSVKVRVGAQGKPSLTGQHYCEKLFTIEEISNGQAYCPSLPGVQMFRSADVPSEAHYKELFPLYDGDNWHIKGGWRPLREWFGENYEDSDPDFYFFFGGDESGASFHWHNAAFNVLYLGLKMWRVTPPRYKGLTAVHSDKAQHMLPEEATLRCTQTPGDFIYLPDYWGHLVVNAGYTMGTATLASGPVERMIPTKSFMKRVWNAFLGRYVD